MESRSAPSWNSLTRSDDIGRYLEWFNREAPWLETAAWLGSASGWKEASLLAFCRAAAPNATGAVQLRCSGRDWTGFYDCTTLSSLAEGEELGSNLLLVAQGSPVGGRETNDSLVGALSGGLPRSRAPCSRIKLRSLQSPLAHTPAALLRCKMALSGPLAGQAETVCRESALQRTGELPPSTLRAVPVI